MMRKIVFTGGHHTPALAVIKSLREQAESSLEFSWIGHKFSMWGDRRPSLEYQEITRLGIPFFDLKAGKLYNTFHPLKLLRIPWGFLQAFFLLVRIRPQLVVSFGGYLAVPVVVGAWWLRIPVASHEQTVVVGWASRLISLFAKRIFISFPDSRQFFPWGKVYLTGNPLRQEIFDDRGLFRFANAKQTIYITGGQQGSHLINDFVAENLADLVSKYNVIHQSGGSSVFQDHGRLTQKGRLLPDSLRQSYLLRDFFTADELGSVFARADVVVSRSGANTVCELWALGKVVIFIPISWSSHQEQRENAEFFLRSGGGVILKEKNLNRRDFFEALAKLFSNYEFYRQRSLKFTETYPSRPDKILAGEILKLLDF